MIAKPVKPILGTEASATLRDQLLAELKAIGSSDDATTWAHRILGAKNSLIAADARQVEDAFQTRLASVGLPTGPCRCRWQRMSSRRALGTAAQLTIISDAQQRQARLVGHELNVRPVHESGGGSGMGPSP